MNIKKNLKKEESFKAGGGSANIGEIEGQAVEGECEAIQAMNQKSQN